jgi:hypothetical protein
MFYILQLVEYKVLRIAHHVARTEDTRNSYNSAKNLSEKKVSGVSSSRWEYNMRLSIKEIKFGWIEVN